MFSNNDHRYLSGEVEISEIPIIPANVYNATLDGVSEVDHELYGSRWVFHWRIAAMHPDGGDFEVQVWTPPRFSSTGMASEIARALGHTIVKGAKVDLGSLRGREARLTVILDEEKGRNRVKAVTPAPPKPGPEHIPQSAAEAAEDAAAVAAFLEHRRAQAISGEPDQLPPAPTAAELG